MTRLFFALLLSIGLAASAPAFAQESEASRVPAASAGAEAVALSEASAAAVASDGVEATATGSGQVHRIREMLTRKFGLARVKAEQISAAVMTSASKYSLPPALVLAIISIESRFQDHARGRHGATGLMQVVPAAHKGLVKNLDLTEPATNIEAGSAILHGYLESARGDVGAALKSYGGSTAYARKVSLRAKDFEVVEPASDAAGASAAR
jgi:soluble lytic murein transglycosylase-like protein